ncbi:hypothetical protein GCM10022225_06670 [Plantactinospora mayteni]|uniref:Uncharacterized protein n=1 Tax=Plantactinospora mayteni TaxID=566021 RepID=A0ABQ4ER64_9ACTN|nr:hypothetical protein Pma05_37290 [Plantactinospora mayteni]
MERELQQVAVGIGIAAGLAALATLTLVVVRQVNRTWDRRQRDEP